MARWASLKEADIVDSVPPSYFGGNVDDWRVTEGATMYYPVAVPGALLSVGDPHAGQGDAEINGTAIETSVTGDIQVILHKKADLNNKLSNLNYPPPRMRTSGLYTASATQTTWQSLEITRRRTFITTPPLIKR